MLSFGLFWFDTFSLISVDGKDTLIFEVYYKKCKWVKTLGLGVFSGFTLNSVLKVNGDWGGGLGIQASWSLNDHDHSWITMKILQPYYVRWKYTKYLLMLLHSLTNSGRTMLGCVEDDVPSLCREGLGGKLAWQTLRERRRLWTLPRDTTIVVIQPVARNVFFMCSL